MSVSVVVGFKSYYEGSVKILDCHDGGEESDALGVDFIVVAGILEDEVTVLVGEHDAALLGKVYHSSRNGIAFGIDNATLYFSTSGSRHSELAAQKHCGQKVFTFS